jgi:hypothetical protein
MPDNHNVFSRMVLALVAPLHDLLYDPSVSIMLEMAVFHLATWHKLTLEVARRNMADALLLEGGVVDPPVEPTAPRIVQACALAHARLLLQSNPPTPLPAPAPAPAAAKRSGRWARSALYLPADSPPEATDCTTDCTPPTPPHIVAAIGAYDPTRNDLLSAIERAEAGEL